MLLNLHHCNVLQQRATEACVTYLINDIALGMRGTDTKRNVANVNGLVLYYGLWNALSSNFLPADSKDLPMSPLLFRRLSSP